MRVLLSEFDWFVSFVHFNQFMTICATVLFSYWMAARYQWLFQYSFNCCSLELAFVFNFIFVLRMSFPRNIRAVKEACSAIVTNSYMWILQMQKRKTVSINGTRQKKKCLLKTVRNVCVVEKNKRNLFNTMEKEANKKNGLLFHC